MILKKITDKLISLCVFLRTEHHPVAASERKRRVDVPTEVDKAKRHRLVERWHAGLVGQSGWADIHTYTTCMIHHPSEDASTMNAAAWHAAKGLRCAEAAILGESSARAYVISSHDIHVLVRHTYTAVPSITLVCLRLLCH